MRKTWISTTRTARVTFTDEQEQQGNARWSWKCESDGTLVDHDEQSVAAHLRDSHDWPGTSQTKVEKPAR